MAYPRRVIFLGIGVASVMLPACSAGPQVQSAPADTAAPPPSTTSAPSTTSTTSGPPSVPAPSAPAIDPSQSALPPRDASCTTDSDCGYDFVYLVDGKCCNGTCSPSPANSKHLDAVAATCERLGWAEDGCPTKKCVPPPELACKNGQCVLAR